MQATIHDFPVQEVWTKIDDFPDYEVSSHGRIRSFRRKKHRVLSPFLSKTGYAGVILFNDSGKKFKMVHRLVAEAFLVRPPGKAMVRHNTKDCLDNRVDNLRWSRYQNGPKDDCGPNRTIAVCILMKHNDGAPPEKLVEEFGYPIKTIQKIINGEFFR